MWGHSSLECLETTRNRVEFIHYSINTTKCLSLITIIVCDEGLGTLGWVSRKREWRGGSGETEGAGVGVERARGRWDQRSWGDGADRDAEWVRLFVVCYEQSSFH